MNNDGNGRSAWTAPRLVELKLGMENVEDSYQPLTDGSEPGNPSGSES